MKKIVFALVVALVPLCIVGCAHNAGTPLQASSPTPVASRILQKGADFFPATWPFYGILFFAKTVRARFRRGERQFRFGGTAFQSGSSGENPMKLQTITVEKFRCFERLTLDLHPELTVLVALNGGGKTALLDAARIAVWPFVDAFDLGQQAGRRATVQIEDVRMAKSQS